MKIWKRLLALLLALTMVLSLCACGSGNASRDDSSTKNPTSDESPSGGFLDFFKGLFGSDDDSPSDAPSAEVSDGPDASAAPEIEVDLTQDLLTFAAHVNPQDELLTINGAVVPADLVLYWLFMSCDNFASYYAMFGLNMADYADMLRDDTVSMCTYYTMLRQKAAELGCLPTDAQLQDAHDRMMADGEEHYEMLKAAYGLSDGSMEYIYTMSAYYENLLDAMVPTATDEMLNDYAYQAKHILLKTVDDNRQPLPEDEVAEKKARAEDILAQLQAADDLETKFDELMNEFSEDGRNGDGTLAAPDGYTTTRGEMVSEFEEGALALKPGEISGIVESTYGYHIILRGGVDDLESYAEDCRAYTLDQLLTPVMDEMTVKRSAALDALDLVEFHARYSAYRSAVVEQHEHSEEGAG